MDAILEMLEVDIDPADRVVEIGCGVGRLTRELAGRAARVDALDVSEQMLASPVSYNPGLANVRRLQGDGGSLGGVDDASATVCFSHVVFQHIPDPAVTLGYVREMGRVLGRRRLGGVSDLQRATGPPRGGARASGWAMACGRRSAALRGVKRIRRGAAPRSTWTSCAQPRPRPGCRPSGSSARARSSASSGSPGTRASPVGVMDDVADLQSVGRLHYELAMALDALEARGPHHPLPGVDRRQPEEHRLVAVREITGGGERQQARHAVVLLRADEGAGAEVRDPLEREQLVAKVQQHRAAEDQVERPQLLRGRVIDAHVDPLDARAADLLREPEAVAAHLRRPLLRAAARRPVQVALAVEVEGDDLRAAILHLEGPEPVPGADLQGAHPAHVVREPVVANERAQVEPARRHLAVAELDRVIPGALARLFEQVHGPPLLGRARHSPPA